MSMYRRPLGVMGGPCLNCGLPQPAHAGKTCDEALIEHQRKRKENASLAKAGGFTGGLTYESRVSVKEQDVIEAALMCSTNGTTTEIWRSVMRTQEESIRAKLIELGWTPPWRLLATDPPPLAMDGYILCAQAGARPYAAKWDPLHQCYVDCEHGFSLEYLHATHWMRPPPP